MVEKDENDSDLNSGSEPEAEGVRARTSAAKPLTKL